MFGEKEIRLFCCQEKHVQKDYGALQDEGVRLQTVFHKSTSIIKLTDGQGLNIKLSDKSSLNTVIFLCCRS